MATNNGRPATRRPVNGEKIKALMKSKRMNYDKLARQIGFTRSYVNVSIKYGEMSTDMLTAIARFFKVPENELWQK